MRAADRFPRRALDATLTPMPYSVTPTLDFCSLSRPRWS
jgi:hypothetical protein